MDAPQLHKTKVSDIAFRDPLSEETRKTRTHLLFVAALAVLVKTYDLKITKTPWLNLDVPENAPQILEGALSFALCYFLFVFIIYAWLDFRRWRLAGEIQLVHGSFDLVLQSREHLRVIELQLNKLNTDPTLQASVYASIEAAATLLPEALEKLLSLRAELQRLNWLQWFRVTVIEFALPVALGVFGLTKVATALLPFVQTVVK